MFKYSLIIKDKISININQFWIKKEIYFKILINNILILLFFITHSTKRFLLYDNIENKLQRYIKYKRINNLINYYNYEKELPKIINYIKLLREGAFQNNMSYNCADKPKISFIASVYNKEKYIKSFISSIQNQALKDFELIIVDDCSTDKSINIIKKYKQNDKRIKLFKNNKNKGSLFTRYKGAILSKGEFIIFVDSDDLILKDGILRAYNYIKKNNLDLVEFNSVIEENSSSIFISRRYYKYYNIIYQPILSYIFYYNSKNKKGNQYNTALWDKLIKREVVLNAFNYIGEEFINTKIIIENDVIILFSLFKIAKSFQYIDELGYYYFLNNNDSITNTKNDPLKSNLIISSIFYNIKFLYEKTGNTYFDKYFCLFKMSQGCYRYKKCFNHINKEYGLIKSVFNELLESNYISVENKIIIRNIFKKINKIKNNNRNHSIFKL